MRSTPRSARRHVAALLAARVAGSTARVAPAARPPGPAKVPTATDATAPADLPDDGPPALYRAEPALPAPAAWPGTESFPRTSGTGRVAAGGLYWTDFLYDDHGAIGMPGGDPMEAAGTPAFG